jgi:hypothetical protein
MQFVMISEIIAAVAGGLIILAAQWIFERVRERKGGYTGIWEDQIFDDAGQIVKRDRHDLRQKGNEAFGYIERIFPDDQKHRKWHLYGRFRGSDFFAIFWATDPSVPSYGCWYVHQTDDDTFSGYYLRLSDTDHKQVATIPIRLQRQRKR